MKKKTKAHGVHVGGNVVGKPITGDEALRELMGKMSAYGGREVRNGYEIIRRMVKEDHTIVLAFSGAMASAGFVQSVVNPLVAHSIVDIIVTTGANIYHDVQRIVAPEIREVNPVGDDLALRRHGWTRIYDHAFREQDLFATDCMVQQVLLEMRQDMCGAMTTPEFHQLFVQALHRVITSGRHNRAAYGRSLLRVAKQYGVPIFCGAPQDGSIFLNIAYMASGAWRPDPQDVRGRPDIRINLARDIQQFAAYHLLAKREWSKKLSIIIFGGGVPKNYALQPEPFLSQICGIPTDGYDCDVQVCDAHVQNGGLSSCPAAEGHTWGKTSVECVQRGSQYVFADATIVAPLYVGALLGELGDGRMQLKEMRNFLARSEEAGTLFHHQLKSAEARRMRNAERRK